MILVKIQISYNDELSVNLHSNESDVEVRSSGCLTNMQRFQTDHAYSAGDYSSLKSCKIQRNASGDVRRPTVGSSFYGLVRSDAANLESECIFNYIGVCLFLI